MTPRDLLACMAAIGLGLTFFGSVGIAGWEILHHEEVNELIRDTVLFCIVISGNLLHLNVGVGLNPPSKAPQIPPLDIPPALTEH